MARTILSLLMPRHQAVLLDSIVRNDGAALTAWRLLMIMAAGAATYGVVLGAWRGGLQMLYSAIKLPLVLAVTSVLTLAFNWLTGYLLGLRISFSQAAALTFLVLATASIVLASLAPVAGLFVFSAPTPSFTERATHNLLYLMHTGLVGLAGLLGTSILWRALAYHVDHTGRAAKIFTVWLTTFTIVGGEAAWALRPFVGSIYYPVAFLRTDPLDGNVYEFILRDIAPYLLTGSGP
jgi:hypothetical protein